MDDLHIDHDGTNYVAEAYSDKWVAGSDWFTLTITPTSYGFPDTDGKVKTVPDDMTPNGLFSMRHGRHVEDVGKRHSWDPEWARIPDPTDTE